MAHDEHPGGVGDQLAQSVGHDPAFDLGALLHLLIVPAVKLKVEFIFDDGLVAAPGQGHLDGEGGVLQQFPEAGGVPPHADGKGGGHAVGAGDLPHLVQQVELGVHEALQVLLLKDEKIAVPVVPGEQPAGGGHPGGQTLVDLAEHGGAGGLVGVFHHVLVVVQQQQSHHGPAAAQGLPVGGVAGDLHPVGGGHAGRAAPPLLGAHQTAKDQKFPLAHLDLAGALGLALQQPAGVEAGHGGGELGVKQVVPAVGELEEPLVGPDHLVGVRVEDDHGQRGVEHGVPCGHIHVGGYALQVAEHLFLPAAAVAAEVKEENDHHYPLHGGHGRAEKSGGCGKTDQTKQIEPQTGLQKPGEPLVHSYTSWKSPLRGTGITRIVYFIRKALKLQERGPAFDGGNNDEGPAAERDVFRHFLYCSKVVRLI